MYPKKISIFIALLFVAAGSIYYFAENSTPESVEREGPPYVDSLAPDNRPSFTAQTDTVHKDTVPEPVGENLAPGTALLRATILDIEEMEDEIDTLKVRVEEVLGYGSSTPPISTGTEFEFDVSHYLKQNPQFRDKINNQSEVNVLVSYQEGMRLDDSDSQQQWSFVELSEN